jgi:hypothetical protein
MPHATGCRMGNLRPGHEDREEEMQGMTFALEAFIVGVGVVDWLLFDSTITGAFLNFVGL